MGKIKFIITTRDRPESCQNLVNSLQGLGEILVLNDGCDYDISGCVQYKTDAHYGKQNYYALVNKLFNLAGRNQYTFMLPDDFLPEYNMVERAIDIWDSIDDDRKICLNLYADRVGLKCWTNFLPINKGNVWQTQWVDMCFMCPKEFFIAVGRLPPRPSLWPRDKNISSGVGAYISRRLNSKGYSLYQAKESLVVPQPEHYISQMYKI